MSSIPRNPRTSPGTGGPGPGAAASLLSSPRVVAMILIAAGVALVLGAIFADPLGISGGGEGFGWKQMIAAIAGLVLALLGTGVLLGGFSGRGRGAQHEPLVPLDTPE